MDLPDDNVSEVMKHLGRANFAFRATCRRFWALFNKNRATLEKKSFELYSCGIEDFRPWYIKAKNTLFPDQQLVLWVTGMNWACLKKCGNELLKPNYILGDFRISLFQGEINIKSSQPVYYMEMGPMKKYDHYFGKAKFIYYDPGYILTSDVRTNCQSKEDKEEYGKYFNRVFVEKYYEYFIKGTELEKVFKCAFDHHLEASKGQMPECCPEICKKRPLSGPE